MQRTTYVYGEDGRLLGAETRTMPVWDELDKLILLAHVRNEGDRCHCGGYMSETCTTNPMEDLQRALYRVSTTYCLKCHAQYDWEERRKTIDQLTWNTPLRQYPEARRLWVEAVPPE